MEATNKKRDLEDILSAAERILKAREESVQENLFGETDDKKVLNEIQEIFNSAAAESHDAQKAYDLYYGIIKKLVMKAMPKCDIRDLVQLLICNLLTGVELLRNGMRRGMDSRQQSNERFDEAANLIMEWSERPYDYIHLAQTLLNKCIEKGISPKERTLADFIPQKKS